MSHGTYCFSRCPIRSLDLLQVARSLLLCGPTEVAVRQSARGLTRCLVSLSAAVGTMARPHTPPAAHAAEGGAPQGHQEGNGDECGGEETVECLVFVAGGGGFEGLLELQLRELLAVATRGPDAAAAEEEEGEEEEQETDEVCAGDGREAAAAGHRKAAVRLSPAEAAAVGEAAAEEAAALSQVCVCEFV